MQTSPAHPFHRWVRIILDAEYGEQLAALPADQPIWIVDSPGNTPVAQRLWRERPASGSLMGIATFKAAAETREQVLLDILDIVDEHQGETSAGGGYGTLEVVGCQPNEKVEAALADLCLIVVETTKEGFVARCGWPWHIKPRLDPAERNLSLDAILRECGISAGRYEQLQADVRRTSIGCGKSGGLGEFELAEIDWSLLSDVSDYIWNSEWDIADKFVLGINFYDRLPHYFLGLVPLWHVVRSYDNPLPHPETMIMIWDALAYYLSREEAWYHNTVAYVLWVDFFEHDETVEPAWVGLLNSPQLTPTGKVRLLSCCGPVPYKLKAPFYREMQRHEANHPHILDSLLFSATDVFGQLDKDAARELLAELRVDHASEAYQQLRAKLNYAT